MGATRPNCRRANLPDAIVGIPAVIAISVVKVIRPEDGLRAGHTKDGQTGGDHAQQEYSSICFHRVFSFSIMDSSLGASRLRMVCDFSGISF